MKRLIFVAFIIGIGPHDADGQNAEREVSLLLKMLIFQETATKGIEMNKDLFDRFNSLEIEWDTIKVSENLPDYVFLKVSPVLKNPRNISMENFPLIPDNCEGYVVGASRGLASLFRLKGFKSNDFPSFIMDLRRKGYAHVNSRRAVVKHYIIPGLDINCLYKSFSALSYGSGQSDCLKACSDVVTVE